MKCSTARVVNLHSSPWEHLNGAEAATSDLLAAEADAAIGHEPAANAAVIWGIAEWQGGLDRESSLLEGCSARLASKVTGGVCLLFQKLRHSGALRVSLHS